MNVTDYLLKPFTFERFVKTVERVRLQATENTETDSRIIFIKTEYRLGKYRLRDILYIEGIRDYRKVHTISKNVILLQTFSNFETEVPAKLLCRVHKSCMAAPAQIDSKERGRIKVGAAYTLISETCRKRFFDLINHQGK